jgi:8-amino-7-oxononanoate synthase
MAGPSRLDAELARELARLDAAGLRRALDAHGDAGGVDFTSNDVLGFARRPELIVAAQEAARAHGAGAGAARLLGGGCAAHRDAETRAAEWLSAESALLFPSGYQCNLGVVGALAGRGDAVFSDALNHASLIDAARLSRAHVHVFAHLDLDELQRQLARARSARRRLVLVEAVFSMDGDLAPLADLAELCARHDAWLVVDEAHSAGLLGPRGAGAFAASGAPAERLAARIVTGGKALGVAGAFAAGSAALRDVLLHRARSFLFTTAPPPAVAGALARAVELIGSAEADELRARCRANARRLARAVGGREPAAAIVPFAIGAAARAVAVEHDLRARGLAARAVRPPTVPDGTARLRLVARASHDDAEIAALADALAPYRSAPAAARAAVRAPVLCVVGTDTGVGKTVAAALLLRAALRRGPARYWKPVQTGGERDTDAVRALAAPPRDACLAEAWHLPLPASPDQAAAAAGVAIDPERLEQELARVRASASAPVIVELAGGLLVPHRADYTQADWLARAALATVLVARSGLGTLNHTLLTLEALRARALEPRALFLVGPPHAANRATLEAMADVPRIFELPPLAPLDTAALDRWLDAHDLAGLLP